MPRASKSTIVNQQKEALVAETETETETKAPRVIRAPEKIASDNLATAKQRFETRRDTLEKSAAGLSKQAKAYQRAKYRLTVALGDPMLPAEEGAFSMPQDPAILDVVTGTATPGNAIRPAHETTLALDGPGEGDGGEFDDDDESDDDGVSEAVTE